MHGLKVLGVWSQRSNLGHPESKNSEGWRLQRTNEFKLQCARSSRTIDTLNTQTGTTRRNLHNSGWNEMWLQATNKIRISALQPSLKDRGNGLFNCYNLVRHKLMIYFSLLAGKFPYKILKTKYWKLESSIQFESSNSRILTVVTSPRLVSCLWIPCRKDNRCP